MTDQEPHLQKVEIDRFIRKDAALTAAVERATKILETEVGPAIGQASASWNLVTDDRWDWVVILEISEEGGRARTVFSRDRLINLDESRLRTIMIHFWGDLLQDTSHRQIRELKLAILGTEDV